MISRIARTLFAVAGVTTLGTAMAQTSTPADAKPAYTLTGNLAIVSERRRPEADRHHDAGGGGREDVLTKRSGGS